MKALNLDKYKLNKFNIVKKELLEEIKPKSTQIKDEQKFIDSILKKIDKMPGKHISAVIGGSFGKNTNLKDSKDFDVFVLYPPTLSRDEFVKEGLELGKKVFKGHFWEKKFSEHPYISGKINNYDIEIVPTYKVESSDKLISAVDRSVFHLLFILKNMSEKQKDDVRLLKKFLKTINSYGADSEFDGFSGYLCELLILYYSDFKNLLINVANWKYKIKITLLKEQEEFLSNFLDDFVVIDPVDSNRNVASAVSKRQLNVFIAAARSFLQNPDISFFTKPKVKKLNYHQLVGNIEMFNLAVVEFNTKDMLKDIAFAKIKKYANKLVSHLEFVDFEILKYNVYYNKDTELSYLIIMSDTLNLNKYKKAKGPFVTDLINSQNYLETNSSILGPYIMDDRWYSVKLRKKTNINDVISEFVEKNFEIKTNVFVSSDIKKLYLKREDTLDFFSDFFVSKEKFLL